MSVSYKREINHNYLIIDSSEQAASGYECRMLAGNTIEGLLKFRVRHHEDKKEFYYEITSKQPLSRLLDQRMITGSEIRALILGMSAVISSLEEFLLKEDQILLEPEYIYIGPDGFSAFFCMVPGYPGNFPSALTSLLEYLLSKVNHQDRDGVILAYNLYHESLKENYGMQDLLSFLSAKGSGIFEAEEPAGRQEKEEIDRRQPDLECVLQNQVSGRVDENKDISRAGDTMQSTVSNKTVGSRFLKVVIRILCMAVTGMVGTWFLTGEEGLYRYGGWLLAGAFVIAGAKEIVDLFFLNKNKTEAVDNIEENVKKPVETGQGFKIIPREENVEHWTDWKESDKMEISGEPQTTLLAELDKPEQLALMEGLNREQGTIEITYLPFVIGKNEELSDYCLCQPTVSRLHLRVDKKEDVFIVTDLNSTNGTVVEGYHLQANETVSIKNGDIIYVADVGFRFVEMNL